MLSYVRHLLFLFFSVGKFRRYVGGIELVRLCMVKNYLGNKDSSALVFYNFFVKINCLILSNTVELG